MAAFRPVDPLFQHRDNTGAVLANGVLEFYESGTNDPKNVYSDEALSVNLGSSVVLDTAGRLPSDVWGVGIYRVRLFTVEDLLVDEADPVQEEGGAGASIPSQTGHTGKLLGTNGSTMAWQAIKEVPDMTGQSGKYLGTDGTDPLWQTLTIPDVPADGIETGTKLFRIGGFQCIAGVETMPISGTHTSSKAVTFATPFNAAPYFVVCSNTTGGISPSGAQGTITAQSQSATGFTINLDVNIDSTDAGWNINTAANVQWLAFGPVDP